MHHMRSTLLASAALLGLASAAQAAEPATIRLCTGDDPGVYFDAGEYIAGFSTAKIKIVTVPDTGGTWSNIHRAIDLPATDPNACDAFIGQPDGPALLARKEPGKVADLRKIGSLHREYLQVVCSQKSGFTELDDLEGNAQASVALGADGSGAWLVWQNIIAEDDGYDAIQVRNVGGIEAANDAAEGRTSCWLRPAAAPDPQVAQADDLFGDRLVLASANDKDFNDAEDIDGTALYTDDFNLPHGLYKHNLQTSWTDNSVETISWLAGVYVNSKRVPKGVTGDLIGIVANAAKGLRAKYGQ
jgi:TRAP-type uncharacterized transport system substrate-binding protein